MEESIFKHLIKLCLLAVIVCYGYYVYDTANDRGQQLADELQDSITIALQSQKEKEAGATPTQRLIKSFFPLPPKPQQRQEGQE
ncbi:MAG: hypothetical protein ABSB95_08075 [Dissulfurispiraceae bacterium]|jgi:hypothetical protein